MRYEMAAVVAEYVQREIDPFACNFDASDLEARLVRELECKQFIADPSLEPAKYRFPLRKAKLIVAARKWLVAELPSAWHRLLDDPDERARRAYLCCCPGIGLKTASWILRNIGLAQRLAIVDVHVRRALVDCGLLSNAEMRYEEIEDLFVSFCDKIGALPSALDLFLWEWQRGTLRPLNAGALVKQ